MEALTCRCSLVRSSLFLWKNFKSYLIPGCGGRGRARTLRRANNYAALATRNQSWAGSLGFTICSAGHLNRT